MKNTKKIISLVLAICMLASLAISASAANTVDASGGTGTSSVTLSSTADGSLDGDPSATKMSVVVPTVLPIAVGTDGSVATASDAKIINNSYGAVKVNSVSIEAAQGWSLAAFGSKDTLAHEKVNSNKFGFQLAIGGGAAAATDNKNAMDYSGGVVSFIHNDKNLLKCDVVILDEMSMVDVKLFQALIAALRYSCRIIMVGDADQLPSVGPGNILGEVIRSGLEEQLSLL